MADLFDYADRLVNGLCQLILNIIDSAFQLLSQPISGIFRLNARFRTTSRKQASAITLIFFFAATFQVILTSLLSLDRVRLFSLSNRLSEFISDAYEQTLGERLTSTIIVAAIVASVATIQIANIEKLKWLSLKAPGRSRIGYFIAQILLTLCVFETIASCVAVFAPIHIAVLPVLVILTLAATYAIGSIARSAIPQLSRRDLIQLIIVLFLWQQFANAYAGLYGYFAGDTSIKLTALNFRHGGPGEINVNALVYNPRASSLIVRRDDILLVGNPDEKGQELHFDIKEPSADAPYLILPAKQTTAVRVVAQVIKDAPPEKEYRFWFSITATSNDLRNEHGERLIARSYSDSGWSAYPMSVSKKK